MFLLGLFVFAVYAVSGYRVSPNLWKIPHGVAFKDSVSESSDRRRLSRLSFEKGDGLLSTQPRNLFG